jgi:hypothetical protein
MSSQGGSGGSRLCFSQLEKCKASAMIPDLCLDTDDEYDTMDMGPEVASLRITKELQRHYDVEGEDVALRLGVGITTGGLTQLRQGTEFFGGEAFETVPEDGSSIGRRILPC